MRALSDSGQGEDVRIEADQEHLSRSIAGHTSPDAGITDITRTQVSDPEEGEETSCRCCLFNRRKRQVAQPHEGSERHEENKVVSISPHLPLGLT